MTDSELFSGKYIPGASVVHRLDAAVKLICFFMLLAGIIVTDSAFGYIFTLCITAGVILVSRLPLKNVLGSIMRLWSFFLVIFLMNALFFADENALASWWIFSLSIKGIMQGLNVVIHVVAVIILANVLTLSTPPMDMTDGLNRLMRPLKIMRLPTEEFAMIISVAIQFIPRLFEETDMIKKAQIARGARFESKKITERALSFAPLLIPVFTSAFRRADELSMAMEARGYRNARQRTARAHRKINACDFASAAVCAAALCVQILLG